MSQHYILLSICSLTTADSLREVGHKLGKRPDHDILLIVGSCLHWTSIRKTAPRLNRAIASMCIPACPWRWTGEIFKGNAVCWVLISDPSDFFFFFFFFCNPVVMCKELVYVTQCVGCILSKCEPWSLLLTSIVVRPLARILVVVRLSGEVCFSTAALGQNAMCLQTQLSLLTWCYVFIYVLESSGFVEVGECVGDWFLICEKGKWFPANALDELVSCVCIFWACEDEVMYIFCLVSACALQAIWHVVLSDSVRMLVERGVTCV